MTRVPGRARKREIFGTRTRGPRMSEASEGVDEERRTVGIDSGLFRARVALRTARMCWDI